MPATVNKILDFLISMTSKGYCVLIENGFPALVCTGKSIVDLRTNPPRRICTRSNNAVPPQDLDIVIQPINRKETQDVIGRVVTQELASQTLEEDVYDLRDLSYENIREWENDWDLWVDDTYSNPSENYQEIQLNNSSHERSST